LIYYLKPIITHEINARVPDALTKAINDKLEEALAKLQVRVPWKETIMDFSLMSPPFFSPDLTYFSFQVNGEFSDRQKPTTCPYIPSSLPGSLSANMLQVYVDDFVPNCALRVFYEKGDFAKLITASEAPPAFQKWFNTSEYWLLLPPLTQAYPNMMMEILFQAASSPFVVFNPANITAQVVSYANVSVLPPGKKAVQAFSLAIKMRTSIAVSITSDNVIKGKLNSLVCDISLASSSIGKLNILPIIDAILEPLCSTVLPGIANPLLEHGIAIPSEFGFSLVNPQVVLGNGYVGFSSSVKFAL